MKTEVQRTTDLLAELGVSCISIFPGTNRDASAEDVARQVRLSLEEVMSGEARVLDF